MDNPYCSCKLTRVLGGQYRAFVAELVAEYTANGIVTILDLVTAPLQ